MPNAPRRETAYRHYVCSEVPKAIKAGQGIYNYKELAAMVGLKPTQHFRRHIKAMADSGTLVLINAFTPRGGIELRFGLPSLESVGDLPF